MSFSFDVGCVWGVKFEVIWLKIFHPLYCLNQDFQNLQDLPDEYIDFRFYPENFANPENPDSDRKIG